MALKVSNARGKSTHRDLGVKVLFEGLENQECIPKDCRSLSGSGLTQWLLVERLAGTLRLCGCSGLRW